MELLTPSNWKDYELIDCGDREKLERFGNYLLRRPEPQAVWSRSLSESDWETQASAQFIRKRGSSSSDSQEKGEWIMRKGMPERWFISYSYKDLILKFRLGLTAFGHIGIFPEQACNWEYIYDKVRERPHPLSPSLKQEGGKREGYPILNLFAYTGGSSLAARAAGADTFHVDSVKNVISWGKEIMETNGLADIHWVTEDAIKFVRREVTRGKKYRGIILDPPAYGRGPDGEKWVLEEQINEMTGLCRKLLEPAGSFFILNMYSMGLSALVAESLVRSHFKEVSLMESGEFYFADKFGKRLPLGTFLRFTT